MMNSMKSDSLKAEICRKPYEICKIWFAPGAPSWISETAGFYISPMAFYKKTRIWMMNSMKSDSLKAEIYRKPYGIYKIWFATGAPN